MAESSALEQDASVGNDYAEHEATYLGFVRLIKWCVGAMVVILVLMAYFLV